MKKSSVKKEKIDPILKRICAKLDAMQLKLEQTAIKINEHLEKMKMLRGDLELKVADHEDRLKHLETSNC